MAVDLFKVLAHPDRLRIACALGDGRVTTQKALMQEFGWPQSTAARHLTILRNRGLVASERDGTEVLLRMGEPLALNVMDTVCAWVRGSASGERAASTSGTAPMLTATSRRTGAVADGEDGRGSGGGRPAEQASAASHGRASRGGGQ